MDQYYGSRRSRKKIIRSELSVSNQSIKSHDNSSKQDNIRELEKEYRFAKRHGQTMKARSLAKKFDMLKNAEQDSYEHGDFDLNQDNGEKLNEEYRSAKRLSKHGTAQNLKK